MSTKILDLLGLQQYDTKIKQYIGNGLSGKQDTLTAGTGITISGNTISSNVQTPHLYKHEISLDLDNAYLTGTIYTNFDTQITKNNITSLLSNYKNIPLNSYNGDANTKFISVSLVIDGNNFSVGGVFYNNNNFTSSDDIFADLGYTFADISDYVVQIF